MIVIKQIFRSPVRVAIFITANNSGNTETINHNIFDIILIAI